VGVGDQGVEYVISCLVSAANFSTTRPSSLARGAGSPWRPGLEIGAVCRVKQSAKQFKGKARSEKQDVKKAEKFDATLLAGRRMSRSYKRHSHTFSSHRFYYI
jgi:hypothetical protein